jgi:hypothetical protein
MRRAGIVLIALATLAAAAASGGSSALGSISGGPLTAAPNDMSFGHVAQGAPQTITETLTNNGTQALNIQTVQVNGANQGDFQLSTDTCTSSQSSLNIGDSCSVDVTFAPSGNGGESATLDITDDDSADGATQSQDLTGTGVATQFSLTTPADFGAVVVGQTSADQGVTVTNNTDYPTHPSGPTITGANPGQFNLDTNTCAGNIATTCTVNVNYAPTSTGSASATLNAGGQSVALTGTGTQANASVSPNSIAFGSQPVATNSGTHNITLQNTGTAALTYGSVSFSGANTGDFAVSDAGCQGVILQPNDQCTITAAFVPIATGSRSETVTVHDSDPNNPTQTVTLTGNGTPSSVGFTPGSVTFVNPVVAGLPSPVHNVTITNTTNSNLPISTVTLTGANFKSFIRSADNCSGQMLAPNATCTVHVEFAPTAAGNRTAFLQVNDTGPIAPHSHEVTLTGKGIFPNNPKAVHGSVGCSSARFTWVSPTATRFAGVRVVRNHLHFPANVTDGAPVRRSSGIATDTGLKHFTTYFYRVFATYHSKTRPSQINYSAGVRFKLRTGEICTPQNGARIRDLTPRFTWLAHSTQAGYAFVLQRGGDSIMTRYTPRRFWNLASSWRDHGRTHRLVRGGTYTFFLFAYPKSHPDGILIGQMSFYERR